MTCDEGSVHLDAIEYHKLIFDGQDNSKSKDDKVN